QVKLWVNGDLKQNYNTSDMAHKIPRCIEWVTSIHSLDAGDIIATGTNHRGLSGSQNGDRIEIETEGLGRLRFNIRDDLKRTWGRRPRLDRHAKEQEGTTPQLTGKHTPGARLRVDHVDLIQLHSLGHPDDWDVAMGPDGALEAAIEARRQGLVRFVGVTGHGWTIAAMHRRSLARFDFDSVLMPYNFFMAANE